MSGVKITAKVYAFLYALVYLYGLFYFVCFVSRLSPIVIVHDYGTYYDLSTPFANFVQQSEYYSDFALSIATFLCYVLSVLNLLKQKRNSLAKKASWNEIRILIQFFVLFASTAVLELLWMFGFDILPESVWTGVTINCLVIIHSGWVCPILCLVFNRTIRNGLILRKTSTVSLRQVT
ncbi:hypothetical protein L596_020591 [Steinernema carpocapsae]|uniref:7TM GPCR serpentine receptor class x (Srx) domain-containing protein n=1 Tax=Steinernema carpocapsae TaxID=34508 RepID=A0A4U5MTZ9_STECR|nr:hypothetical protein L596_020591 [Steinernema carpocapsae]